MLIRYLPGLDSSLQRVQGSLIATDIGEVAVEMRRDREEKSLALQADKEKGIPDLLGSNLAYLICLGQVAAHKDLPLCGSNLQSTRSVNI